MFSVTNLWGPGLDHIAALTHGQKQKPRFSRVTAFSSDSLLFFSFLFSQPRLCLYFLK